MEELDISFDHIDRGLARRMSHMRYSLADELKKIRQNKGLSVEEVAERMGTPVHMVVNIEDGERNPTVLDLITYCLAVGAELSFNVIDR